VAHCGLRHSGGGLGTEQILFIDIGLGYRYMPDRPNIRPSHIICFKAVLETRDQRQPAVGLGFYRHSQMRGFPSIDLSKNGYEPMKMLTFQPNIPKVSSVNHIPSPHTSIFSARTCRLWPQFHHSRVLRDNLRYDKRWTHYVFHSSNLSLLCRTGCANSVVFRPDHKDRCGGIFNSSGGVMCQIS
jgi:hypothetical protein